MSTSGGKFCVFAGCPAVADGRWCPSSCWWRVGGRQRPSGADRAPGKRAELADGGAGADGHPARPRQPRSSARRRLFAYLLRALLRRLLHLLAVLLRRLLGGLLDVAGDL